MRRLHCKQTPSVHTLPWIPARIGNIFLPKSQMLSAWYLPTDWGLNETTTSFFSTCKLLAMKCVKFPSFLIFSKCCVFFHWWHLRSYFSKLPFVASLTSNPATRTWLHRQTCFKWRTLGLIYVKKHDTVDSEVLLEYKMKAKWKKICL